MSTLHKALIILLLLASAILLFARLGDWYLWEDEAETAVISQNILRTAAPSAYDGTNIVTQEAGMDSNQNHVWTLQSWLPHYTTALSFRVLGVNTWTARIPYSAFGLFAVWMAFLLSYKQKNNFAFAFSTAFFLASSIVFILHVRQCRYYSPLILFSMLWLFCFWETLQNNSRKNILTTICIGSLLFYTQYLAAITVFLSSFIGALLSTPKNKKQLLPTLTLTYFGIAVLTAPWIIYVQLWKKLFEAGGGSIYGLHTNLYLNLCSINHFIFPLLFILIIVVLIKKQALSPFENYLGVFSIIFFIISSCSPLYPDIRYLLPLVFCSAYFISLIFTFALAKNKLLGFVFAVSIIFSNFWSLPCWMLLKTDLPPLYQEHYRTIRFDLCHFVYELTHKNSGPIETASAYLNGIAAPGQTIFVSYEAEPLIFYTKLQVLREIPFDAQPDWIILRGGKYWYKQCKWVLLKDRINYPIPDQKKYIWNFHQDKETPEIHEKRKSYIENYLKNNNYKKRVFPVENSFWENRPTPLWHRYGNEKIQEPLVVYSKT